MAAVPRVNHVLFVSVLVVPVQGLSSAVDFLISLGFIHFKGLEFNKTIKFLTNMCAVCNYWVRKVNQERQSAVRRGCESVLELARLVFELHQPLSEAQQIRAMAG